jgi:hypothetical protein
MAEKQSIDLIDITDEAPATGTAEGGCCGGGCCS